MLRTAWLLGVAAVLACCHKPKSSTPPATISGPLIQRAYVWQREWNPQVSRSVAAHAASFETLDLLAAQIEWRAANEEPVIIRPAIDWAALRAGGKPVGLVVRVQHAGNHEAVAAMVARILSDRLTEARAASVSVVEFQIDYDCAQKHLADYQRWLVSVRSALQATGIPLRITTLPSWLGEPAFVTLVDAVDGYILQVHSFDLTTLGKAPTVCDPEMAREWVARAAKLDRPFYVALPTYRCVAGYAPDGRCLGVAADGAQPSWPSGTRMLEFVSDAGSLAELVEEWTKQRPATMQGLYWYRLPMEGELRNWRWPTLAAVMAGRAPKAKWEVRASPGNPTDFMLWNTGENDEPLPRIIRVTWSDNQLPAATDALGGWSCQSSGDHVEFRSGSRGTPVRLLPGNSIPLGWIRYHEAPPPDMTFGYEIVR
ncbi:MAG: DUF3142 domain-containing protein [Luteolibacter sp.]